MPVTVNPQDPPKSSIIATLNGNKVGYLYLESFTISQFKNITEHFEAFKNAGIHELVLDLRYNTGGMMSKAIMLASLIGGETVSGKLFIRWEPSLRYEDNEKQYIFESIPESMQTHRLVVLSTDDTCSASEIIINGLRPYIPVYTVGSTTCGKPFGMDIVGFGDKTLAPVTARSLSVLKF
jgi:carboxyl-terminal processing protease